MRAILQGMALSFSYFSMMPIRLKKIQQSKKSDDAILLTLPFVGLILALVSVVLFLFLKELLPLYYSAILSACMYMILYGFLHLEAVCDVCDAWYAALSKKDVYAIMKEPHVGAMGIIGVVFVIVLKVAAITMLLVHEQYFVFVAVAVFGRWGLIVGLNLFEFHKNSYFAQQLKQSAQGKIVLLSFCIYGLIVFVCTSVTHLLVFTSITLVAVMFILKQLKKRLGFLNGDALGFSLEITELILLNAALMLL